MFPYLLAPRITANREVADLAGGAIFATYQLTVDAEAETNTGAQRDESYIGDILRAAMPNFAQQPEIDIILNSNFHSELL